MSTENQQLIFWETISINKTYWSSWKNLYKKRAVRKLPKQITKEDKEDLKKFYEFCEKKWYTKNWVWDYSALRNWVKNLNLKDIYKLYSDNKKNIKSYFILKNKKVLTLKQERELKALKLKITF